MKKLSFLFALLAALLTNVMTAVTAYKYGIMKAGTETGGYSAPAGTAFLYIIPFAIGIAVCILLAVHFRKTSKNSQH